MAKPRNPRLDELWDELRKGKIYECSIRDPKWRLDGLQEGDTIWIDIRPSILETLIHELIHRRLPRWGERRVTLTARNILCHMTDDELHRWWQAYQQIKRRKRPLEVDLDE